MKVKVIDVTGARNLAIGKIYDVVEQKANGNFVITNEVGVNVSFKASRFQVVTELVADVTYKVGDVLKEEEGDDKFLLIGQDKLVAMVLIRTGQITNGFHPVADTNKITKEDMQRIDSDEGNGLVKSSLCSC